MKRGGRTTVGPWCTGNLHAMALDIHRGRLIGISHGETKIAACQRQRSVRPRYTEKHKSHVLKWRRVFHLVLP